MGAKTWMLVNADGSASESMQGGRRQNEKRNSGRETKKAAWAVVKAR